MIAFWYGIVSFMMLTYVVLDGRNFGAGMLHLLVARTPLERRQVVAAIGPLWVWHEVWIIGFGGTLVAAFPKLMAASFSGYYLALFLVLWCYVFRGLSIEAGGHIPDRMWQSFWDVILTVSNYLLAILFGAALGNLSRGVPVDDAGVFSMAFFTNFSPFGDPPGKVGLLDWYTVSMGVVVLIVLAAHGATYLAMRTTGAVYDRSVRFRRLCWALTPGAVILISIETWFVRPALLGAFFAQPVAWLFALVVIIGAAMLITGMRARDDRRCFFGSGAVVVGMLASGAAAIYPVILYSTLDPKNSLTAQNTAASMDSLMLAAIWWPIGGALAFVYLWYIARYFSGKVDVKADATGSY
jgi:cytochrome d ubiquinol oxidase subunit II